MKEMMQYFEFIDSDTGAMFFTYHTTWQAAYLDYVQEYIDELEMEVEFGVMAFVGLIKYGERVQRAVRIANIRHSK